MGYITAVWIISRFLSGPVYSYHGYFRFGSGFTPVFVKFYGSLMAHGYGSEKSRVVTARFNRGFETVKSPAKFHPKHQIPFPHSSPVGRLFYYRATGRTLLSIILCHQKA